MAVNEAEVSRLLEGAPAPRAQLFLDVRAVISGSLDEQFEEVVQQRMLSYVVPKTLYPKGYHPNPTHPLPLASLAVQKSHVALYLFGLYTDPELKRWFQDTWRATGAKLDLGQACLRMRSTSDVSLDTLASLFARWDVPGFVAQYERSLTATPRR